MGKLICLGLLFVSCYALDPQALNKRIEIDQRVQSVVCRTDSGVEKCYYILNKVDTEVAAKQLCLDMDPNARLVSVHSAKEAEFVTELIKTASPTVTSNVWLGLEHGQGGLYRWVDGQSSDYYNWMAGKGTAFDDWDGDGRPWGDCNYLSTKDAKEYGFWFTHGCTDKLAVVCQMTSNQAK